MNRRTFLQRVAALAPSVAGLRVVEGLAAAAGPKSPAPGPNILFCIADDASWPLAGAYGCDWIRTPAFDRVARQGLLFANAWTPNAKCAPSRSSILTGRNPWQLEAAGNHNPFWPAKFKTWPEALLEHGWHVGFTGKGWAPGNPGKGPDGKGRQLCGPPWKRVNSKPPAGGISNCDYAANFEEFLDARPADRPFAFWYGGHEPHRGYEWRSGIDKGGKQLADIDRVPEYWPDNETVRTDMLDYALEVEHFDRHLGRMLASLERRGQLDNTLVVVTSDNGMPFPRVKGHTYQHSNHLPMAIMWPQGIAAPGRTVGEFVSFIDLAPTFLELAGLDAGKAAMEPITGRSLLGLLKAPADFADPARDHVLIGRERNDVGRPHDWSYPVRGIVTREYLYLRNFEPDRWPGGNPETGYMDTDASPTKTELLENRRKNGESKHWDLAFGKRPARELYHLGDDPDCVDNLAQSEDPRHIAAMEKLDAQLIAELTEQQDPRVLGRGHLFDEYPYSNPAVRNYYDRYLEGKPPRAGWVKPSDYEPAPLD